MRKILIFTFLMSWNFQAIADDTSLESARNEEISRLDPSLYKEISENVYIQLYLARLVRSRLRVTEQKAQVVYSEKNLLRLAELYKKRAASLDEYEDAQRRYDAAVATLEQLGARVAEMRAMFNISVDRISVGLDMPVCAEIP